MSRTIVIRFPKDQTEEFRLIHYLRNFGEHIFRHLRDGEKGFGEIDLDEVDAATSHFSIRGVKPRKLRRVLWWTQNEAMRRNLIIDIEVI